MAKLNASPLLLLPSVAAVGCHHSSRSRTSIPLLRSGRRRTSNFNFKCAVFGGDEPGMGQETEPKKKKFITREEEPEEYWRSADEISGKGPMSTPLPYIAILGIVTPFAILGLGFLNGWIELPANYKF